MQFAEVWKWIPKNPLTEFKSKRDLPEIIPLEMYEVDTLYRKRLDLFKDWKKCGTPIFSNVFTGFAFQDLYALLRLENIVRVGLKSEKWLVKKRETKTNVTKWFPSCPLWNS